MVIVLHDILIPEIDEKNVLDITENLQIWRKKNCCRQTDEKYPNLGSPSNQFLDLWQAMLK